ncbi:MAG TPA: O-antigen ligase family protein [Bacteroidales bacterium]|nr:O-antigen ligase family protein [Bacteroidales bacterium]HPI86317.1 O-antigen ligase family protein [Bacteroidales bacterium]HPM92296.1 O-antigen ligase family protein [Bacteroidales bacterium]
MTERAKLIWVYGASAVFIAANAYLFLHDKMWGLAIPFVLLLLILYIFSLDNVLLLITFLTPLAVNIKDAEFGIGISLPSEPLMFGVMLLFILKLMHERFYDAKIMKHPVSIAILINLVWLFITCFTSELPIVSIKFMVARLWFIIPFYFAGILLFTDVKNIRKFQWLYIIPLIIVIFYTLYNHSTYGFDKPHSNMVMKPFYNDHTAYGAIIAMFLPVFVGFSLSREYRRPYRIMSFIVLAILVIGIIFSYSRAAWISVAAALGVFLLIRFRVRFYWILLTVAVGVALFFMFRYQFLDKLEKNKQDSSTDFVEHVQSISNISSDASNLERINRWAAAIRLFKEKPIFGWGPGTYQFVYAPYQRAKEKTIISTNYGDMGNAHSEYIGPLSESGVLGMITFIGIVVTVIYTAIRVYRRSKVKEIRLLSLVMALGLISYYVHGIMNNFLDTDKASVPFWAFTAVIVALDLYHRQEEEKSALKSTD